jgi:hypothetical protein
MRLRREGFTPTVPSDGTSFAAHHWAHTWLDGMGGLGGATVDVDDRPGADLVHEPQTTTALTGAQPMSEAPSRSHDATHVLSSSAGGYAAAASEADAARAAALAAADIGGAAAGGAPLDARLLEALGRQDAELGLEPSAALAPPPSSAATSEPVRWSLWQWAAVAPHAAEQEREIKDPHAVDAALRRALGDLYR